METETASSIDDEAARIIAYARAHPIALLEAIEDERRRRITAHYGVRLNKYIRHIPDIPAQREFLKLDCMEALYGGAAGGGKSDALLMAALQYVDVPGYSAILFRKTYQDLSLSGGLIPRSHEWLSVTDAKWDNTTKTWHFPSGSTLSFGYMDSMHDHYRYQGSEYQFVGWDELTQFPEEKYRYMYSRCRSTVGIQAPLRVRCATNPGGIGHTWVKRRFIDAATKDPAAKFIPARVYDNPHIKIDEYVHSLSYLDPVTRARYLDGDWVIAEAGSMFRREWFGNPVECPPLHLLKVCAWDLAATEWEEGKDPDYTAGCVIGKDAEGIYYILRMYNVRRTPLEVEALIRQTAEITGSNCDYWMEQEPGSSGVNTIDRYKRIVLQGFYFQGEKTTGKKADRARPFSAAVNSKLVRLVQGDWINDFLDQAEAFPAGNHDDMIDAASLAFSKCSRLAWAVAPTEDRPAPSGFDAGINRQEIESPAQADPWDVVRVPPPW